MKEFAVERESYNVIRVSNQFQGRCNSGDRPPSWFDIVEGKGYYRLYYPLINILEDELTILECLIHNSNSCIKGV